MAEYIEYLSAASVLPPKQHEVNDLLLATHHLRIYDGCEFGCPYCDAWSYSDHPINTKIRIPVDLPERFAEDLMHVQPGDVIGLDFGEPYQPAEQQYRVTRKTLETLAAQRQPCVILTKSPRVLDDLPLLREMNRMSFAIVIVTVVTVDESLTQLLEPEAPPVAQRIETIAKLKQGGIPSGFALLPIIPFLTDSEENLTATMESMATAAPDFVVWGPLWMPNDGHQKRILSLVQAFGPDKASQYQSLYETNPVPKEAYQRSLDRSMLMRCQRLGLEPRIPPRIYSDHLGREITRDLTQRRQRFIECSR